MSAGIGIRATRFSVDVALVGVFVAGFLLANDFPERSRIFPQVICVLGAFPAVANLIKDVYLNVRASGAGERAKETAEILDTSLGQFTPRWRIILASGLMFIGLIVLLGFFLATLLWVAAHLVFIARTRWPVVLMQVAGAAAVLFAVTSLGIAEIPSGVLFSFDLGAR